MKPLKIEALAWKQLALLAQSSEEMNLVDLAREAQLPVPLVRQMRVAIQDSRRELELLTGLNDEVVEAWHWADWCQLTHLLEQLAASKEHPELQALVVGVLKAHRQHPAYPVYVQLRQRWQEFARQSGPVEASEADAHSAHKVGVLEECLLEKCTVLVETLNRRVRTLIPCKLTHLDGDLCLIAEELHDHGLVSLPLGEILNLKKGEKTKFARASWHEVNEFVEALRAMNENEVRLVLKITNPDQFKLYPDYQHLGRPCLMTNSQGELIWAAWVEPSDELFAWLHELQNFVEILEPSSFILDFVAYCEENRRRLA